MNNKLNSKVDFRPVSEKDFDRILKLEEESFNQYDRLDRETLIDLFTEFSEGFYIIMCDDVMAGYSVFLIDSGSGYIESIAVSNNFKRSGLGLIALNFMVKCINRMGFKEINLHVRPDNKAAMILYEKGGFVKKETVAGFYPEGESAYLYTMDEKTIKKICGTH